MKLDNLSQLDDYVRLFLNDISMLDVRAPVEFKQGAFPHAENIPLVDDEDRHAIGIKYSRQGQDAAIALGHERISGAAKEARINDWIDFMSRHPDGVLYCFRGGLRSKISQQWIYEKTGTAYPRVKGGYKALRRFLINQLEEAVNQIRPVILGGRTGTGKTILLQKIKHMIDLEAIYNHRGSVFGIHTTPQPNQIDAENRLSIDLLKLRHQGVKNIVFEDESAHIGSRRIPPNLYSLMQQSPVVLLDATQQERVNITFNEYVTNALNEYRQLYGKTKGFDHWADYLMASINGIRRRLGGTRHKDLQQLMAAAIRQHREHHDLSAHRQWIHKLLTEYYDPMYDYQLSKKQDRILFKGNSDQVLTYLRDSI